MLAHHAHQLADVARGIVGAATSEEEWGVLFAEGIEAAIGAEKRWRRPAGGRAALDRAEQALEFAGRARHLADAREVDPGQQLQKTGRRVLHVGQQHRNDRKLTLLRALLRLPDEGELIF